MNISHRRHQRECVNDKCLKIISVDEQVCPHCGEFQIPMPKLVLCKGCGKQEIPDGQVWCDACETWDKLQTVKQEVHQMRVQLEHTQTYSPGWDVGTYETGYGQEVYGN